ncbi:unnamed protein product [Sphacelaria rigidula]
MYGSATELVLTFYGSGVHRFTLDPSLGEFIHIAADVKIPSKPKVFHVPRVCLCRTIEIRTTNQ